MDVISTFFEFLLQWYVWLPLAVVLLTLAYLNFKKADEMQEYFESVLLVLEIPKANDKQELAAEQLFASLHGILRDSAELKYSEGVQEHLSFEIASVDGQIRFYVWVPKVLRNFVEGQIYSQYPTVQIHEANEDYALTNFKNHKVTYIADLDLIEDDALPIKTFQNFEVDPLAGITGALAKLESSGDEMWVQILVKPVSDDWHKDSEKWISRTKAGRGSGFSLKGFDATWITGVLEALWKPPETGIGGAATAPELSERQKTQIAEAEKKAAKLGYEVKIRLVYAGESTTDARLKMQALAGTFKQFNYANLNGFKIVDPSFKKEDLNYYQQY